MGEEARNEGAIAVAMSRKRLFQRSSCMVLEPTQLGVVTAHKGALWLEIVTTLGRCLSRFNPRSGPQCHLRDAAASSKSSRRGNDPQAGASFPIHKLGPIPRSTSGTISGGSKINIVPDHCRLEVDCRVCAGKRPGENFQQHGIEAELRPRQGARRGRARSPRTCVARARHQRRRFPGSATSRGGVARGFTTAPWFSDAAVPEQSALPRRSALGPDLSRKPTPRTNLFLLRDLEERRRFFPPLDSMSPRDLRTEVERGAAPDPATSGPLLLRPFAFFEDGKPASRLR